MAAGQPERLVAAAEALLRALLSDGTPRASRGPRSGLQRRRTARQAPIVFVHGIRMNRGMWTPQMEGLSDEFRVVAVDLPGHGVYRGQDFSLEGACHRIAEVIDEAAEGRALLVGLSMGGFVCIDFVSRYPRKAIGAVLSGCTAQPRGPLTLPYWIGGALARTMPEPMLSKANGWWLRAQFGALAEPAIERASASAASLPSCVASRVRTSSDAHGSTAALSCYSMGPATRCSGAT